MSDAATTIAHTTLLVLWLTAVAFALFGDPIRAAVLGVLVWIGDDA